MGVSRYPHRVGVGVRVGVEGNYTKSPFIIGCAELDPYSSLLHLQTTGHTTASAAPSAYVMLTRD